MTTPMFSFHASVVHRTLVRAAPLVVALAALAACAGEPPQSTSSPALDSGVTSSNGGGIRTLGSSPTVGVTASTPAR